MMRASLGGEKGVRYRKCKAPEGPFRLSVPGPFYEPAPLFKSSSKRRLDQVLVFSMALCLTICCCASGQVSPAESLSLMSVPDDLKVDLVLSEPLIAQPVFLNFDERGRMWVVEYRQYPHPAGLKILSKDKFWRAIYDGVPEAPPNHVHGKDRISIHEDTDGDGTFETSKIFVDGLNMATSVTRGRGGVWVLNPPYLLFYPDKDDNDVPDSDPIVHLKGFWLEDSHSIANSLRWGPDGWLYGAQGSTVSGDMMVLGTQQKTPIHTVGQLIWRYQPEKRIFEVWAEGGGNAFGCEIDSKGRIFSGHNGGDTRGFHYPQHGYLRKGFNKHGPLSNPHAYGYFPAMPHNKVKRFTHTFEIYEGDNLPEKYLGKLFGVDPLNRNVPIAEVAADGASFRTQDIAFAIETSDEWFRPVDLKTGPDGAIYVCDWNDAQVNHYKNHEGQIDKSNGRIYRIRNKQRSPGVKVDLGALGNHELIETLKHPNRWHRQTARRLIADRRDANLVPMLMDRLFQEHGQPALEYFWAIHLIQEIDESLAIRTLKHSDPYVRAWTIRLLGDRRDVSEVIASDLVELAKRETHAEVRSQLASSAKRLPSKHALPILRAMILSDRDAHDRYVPLQVWWAIESKCASDGEKVVGMLDQSEVWNSVLLKEHLLWRLMRRFAASDRRDDLRLCAQLLHVAPNKDAKKRLLEGFEQAFEGRSMGELPAELLAELASIDGGSLTLRLRQREAKAIQEALVAINDASQHRAHRLRLIEVFGQVNIPQAIDPLLDFLAKEKDTDLRVATIAALESYSAQRIASALLVCYETFSKEELKHVQLLLSSRAKWSREFLHAVKAEEIDRLSVSIETLRRFAIHNDDDINALVADEFGVVKSETTAAMKARITEIKNVVSSGTGDPYTGQKLFRESCVKCHFLFNEGGKVGPDLTAYQRHDLDAMLLGIVHPSAEIREGFENYVVVTDEGRVVNGLLADRDSKVIVIRNAEGQVTTIPRDEIDMMKVSPQSLMPEGLLQGLSDEQLRNLFAYLRSTQPLAN